MASRAAVTVPDPRQSLRDLIERECGYLIAFTTQMKEELQADRVAQIQEKQDRNRRKLQAHIHWILPANNRPCDVPLSRTERALCVLHGFRPGSFDQEIATIQQFPYAKTTMLTFNPMLPKYTTWVFLRRNQRMADDQSVVGRRRIYYDRSGNEALICSDSEDDFIEGEEEKHEFSEAEDRILLEAYSRMDSHKHIDADVADVVSHSIGATPAEIKERYKELKLKSKMPQESSSEKNMSEKSLSAVLDSFDTLFCRRCLVFDCRLHGCSQNLVYPSEKQLSLLEPEGKKPCSDQCYLLAGQTSTALVQGSNIQSLHQMNHNAAVDIARNLDTASGEGCSAAFLSAPAVVPIAQIENVAKRKLLVGNDRELEVSKSFGNSIHKKSFKIQSIEPPTTGAGEIVSASANTSAKIRKVSIETCQSIDTQLAYKLPLEGHTTSLLTDVNSQRTSKPQGCQVIGDDEVDDINRRPELKQPTVSLGGKNISVSSNCEWKPLEKDLYIKGLEIFGRNSCLIARNLLSGLKTCSEVSCYMRDGRALMTREMDTVHSEDIAGADNDNKEQEVLVKSRSRLVRKKGRSRRFKYSTKSNGQPSSWKSIGNGDQSCKQYTPCDCKFMCGKECSCLKRGTCCEKFCGCSKSCKNRFRGCHCAKSQCRSRQCPCFAANRECDPDVCRNCWVSCGGGPLGEPPKRGDGQCGNMRVLLRQKQRILLGLSDVAGWGAFIKNTVNKHDYLGEYTGELISHQEADKRGKIYDRANSSFLFDLNDQYVLDAFRHGSKLKFANHSSNPNCYCKVLLVGGDHRVGIFAKEHIESGEELFYDYRYGPDQAPAWARNPEVPKKDDHVPSQSRARKHQSR